MLSLLQQGLYSLIALFRVVCGGVQPTDLTTHQPVVLVVILETFCTKAWGALSLMNHLLEDRVDWGEGESSMSDDKVILAEGYCQRDGGIPWAS